MADNDTPPKFDWLKTAASALAAVSSAVLLSTLGAAGTLIGAAVGSVVFTVTSHLYSTGLARSTRTMAKAQETALLKVGIAQAEVRRAGRRQGNDEAVEAHLEAADERLGQAKADLDEAAVPPPTLRDRLILLPWKRIAVLAAATFAVAVLVIVAFEGLTGRSVSSYTGGSDKDSNSTFYGGSGSSDDDKGGKNDELKPSDDASAPSETPTEPTDQPSDAPTTQAPTDEPTAEPSETPTQEPSETVEPTPTELPAPTPTS